ncbi:MAG: gliding motility-associated ABC transporter ATP-binding subunit GldA, partial [Flavobacteriaceae bacterium]
THILQEIDALCDRVLIINKGRIVLDENLEILRKDQNQIIEVSFDFRIETEALNRIVGVSKVKNTHDFDYEIHVTGKQDLRPAIFDFVHDNGLKILKLQLKNESLEQLFTSLTA